MTRLRDALQLLVPSDDAQSSSDRCHLPWLNLNLPGCGMSNSLATDGICQLFQTVLHFCLVHNKGVQMFTRICVSPL